jgi:hypothetical protein
MPNIILKIQYLLHLKYKNYEMKSINFIKGFLIVSKVHPNFPIYFYFILFILQW